jgi:hypothetical protein
VSDPPGPTIVLLNDCRDQVNFGADVLVDGLIAILSRSLPGATLLPIPSHWLIESEYFAGFEGGGSDLWQPQTTFPAVADQFETIADEWLAGGGGRDVHEYLDRFRQADLVVLNGEGSIYRTNQSAVRELFLAWFAKQRLGIPTVFLNGMVHLTGVDAILPAMVRKTFRALDAVTLREPCSLRNLRRYVPEVHARLFPDSAFVYTRADARATEAVRAIGERIGDSPYFCFDPGAMPMDHLSPNQSGLHAMITALERTGSRAVFVNSSPSDVYIEAVARETNSLFVDTLTDYREYMALVEHAQFVASGRYHNPILAAIMGCPTIAFCSTNHKVHGACETLDGIVGAPYDGTDLRSQLDAIERQARRYIEQRAELRERLVELCDRRRSEVFELGSVAAEALRRHGPARAPRDAEAVGP